jgi:hypothetical protein
VVDEGDWMMRREPADESKYRAGERGDGAADVRKNCVWQSLTAEGDRVHRI